MLRSLFALLLVAAAARSLAATPTEESVETLLEVTKAEALLEQAFTLMEQMVRSGMEQAIAGRQLNDEQRRAVELAPGRIAELMRAEMGWKAMRPAYVAIYRETFEQSDIDGLIAFYRSPAGQSFVARMPAVMQRSLAVTQMQMQAVLPKLQQTMEQILRDAKLPAKV